MVPSTLACVLFVGMMVTAAVYIAAEVTVRTRRFFCAVFPTTSGVTAGAFMGLCSYVVPTVQAWTALAIGALVGYLVYRIVDERFNGRPRVFAPNEYVTVPADWC